MIRKDFNMKQILTFVVFLILAACFAEQALPVTPQTCNDITQFADIWINGGSPVKTNCGSDKCDDSFSKRIVRTMSKAQTQKEFSVKYKFEVKKAGEYKFYAALIHQGTVYSSPVQFRFDDEKWTSISPVNGKRISWGISNAINWESLGKRKLNPGIHYIEFKFDRKAKNGFLSFMCDGIIGLSADAKKKVKIDRIEFNSKPEPGKNLKITLHAVGKPVLASANLSLGGQAIETQSMLLCEGENTFSMALPMYMGANDYSLQIQPTGSPEIILAEKKIIVKPASATVIPGVIQQVNADASGYDIALKSPLDQAGNICCFMFIDNKVYATEVIPVKKGENNVKGKFSAVFLKTAAGRKAELAFYICPGVEGNVVSVEVSFPGMASDLPKPVNYGVFVDRYGHSHPWFMNHRYQYIFDGNIYYPVGGMWCSSTLISNSTDDKVIKRNLEHDRQTIDNILKYGLDDVYLNLAKSAPLQVRQYFIDMLESKGINYGYQLGAGGKANIPAFFITRDNPSGGGRWKGLISGIYEKGLVKAELPRSYKVIGLMLIPEHSAGKCFMVQFTDKEGRDTRTNIIDLDQGKDYSKVRRVAVKVNLPVSDGSTVIVVPLLDAKMHHVDLWDPTVRQDIIQKLSWIKEIKWGPHLRCFIDPAKNETHMVNGTENLRQYTGDINSDFTQWLKRKYGTIARLRENWCADIPNFAAASRVIPFRLKDMLWLCDPKTGAMYKSSLDRSMAWIDYNDMIRETYAGYFDDIAIAIKSMVDVPVVSKSVGVHGSKVHVSRKYRGWDGTGFEVYLNQGFPPEAAGGASRAEAEASSHTMWKVGTEVGYSAQVGNGNAKFFKTRKDIETSARELSLLGVQGFYFFGFDLKPGRMWNNHNYHDFPEGLKWVAEIQKEYGDGRKAESPSSFIFPGGYSWWWWTTRWKSVYDDNQNRIPQSVRINGNEWGYNTGILPDHFKRVIINCPKAPFSIKHADKINSLIQDKRRVVYVGERVDVGTIRELDRFFTKDRIEFKDGSTAQVLKKLPGTKVLAAENGKPWAVKSGNLLIVSRTPVKVPKNNADTGFKYLNPDWLD